MIGPAYKIKTERLLLSCYEPEDAILLKETIDESIDHLRVWLPWAQNEPEELEKKIERIRKNRADFDLDQNYIYGIFLPDRSTLLGVIALMRRIGDQALEIGYWLGKPYTNKGYMLEATKGIVKVAFETLDIKRLEIHCDPRNNHSRNIPQKLNFNHEATIRRNEFNEEHEHLESLIFVLFKEEYERSDLKQVSIKAYNFINQLII